MSDPNRDATFIKRVEPIITPAELRRRYLFGVDIIDNNGNELTDETLQDYIDIATDLLETDLDLNVVPTTICEDKDYFSNDYFEWGFINFNNTQILDIKSVRVVYLQDDNDQVDPNEIALEIPKAWWRIRKFDGLFRLVPNNRFPARLQVDNAGSFFPELFRRNGHVPALWRIEYTCGFEHGKVPKLINAAIGLTAAIYALNIAGDLVLGAGIASSSLSIDGLSQSINTTSSAENHAYSAKLNQYNNQLFGPNERTPGIMDVLRNYYKGYTFGII